MKILPFDVSNKRPKFKVHAEKLFAIAMTLGLWGVLLYSMVDELAIKKSQQSYEMLAFLFGISIFIFAVFGGWQYYNWHRFHGKERRKAFKPQPLSEVAKLYGMTEKEMEQMQKPARQVNMLYENGRYYYQTGTTKVEIRSLREK